MLLTLKEARESSLADIASACPSSAKFASLLNEATERLLRRGDWEKTVVPIYVCVRRGCVTFPRYVGSVRKANVCSHSVPLNNNWYSFLDFDAGRNWRSCYWYGWLGSQLQMTQTYPAPTFDDIYGDGRLVRVYPQANADVGRTVKIFGLDNHGQELKTRENDGSWTPGITITIAKPFGSSSVFVRKIERVIKDETTGPVSMFAYNADGDFLEPLATYEPSETNPEYVRFRITGGWPGCGSGESSCSETMPLVAMVKLRFVPAKLDTDLVLVDNLQALKEMIQSIRYAEQGEVALASQFEARAIRELNMGLRNSGDDSIAISVEPFNGVYAGQRMY
jgi:hypothetical protein